MFCVSSHSQTSPFLLQIDTDTFQFTWHRVYKFPYPEIGDGFLADGIWYGTDDYNTHPTWIRYQVNVRNDTWVMRNRQDTAKEWIVSKTSENFPLFCSALRHPMIIVSA